MTPALISTAQTFYAALSRDNTKAWWDANRATYDDSLKPASLALLDDLAPEIEKMMGCPVTTKLFRPHRDVRFSKDKTPYKPHLHMMWQLQDPDARQSPVYFFGIGADYVTAGAGLMALDKPVLTDWRKFVDLDQSRISKIIAQVTTAGFALRPPALKRVPPPYDKDHGLEQLLRMKGVVASRDIGNTGDTRARLVASFEQLKPLNHLLLQVASA